MAHILPTFLSLNSLCWLYLVVYRQRGRFPIVRLREEVVALPDTYLRSDSDLRATRIPYTSIERVWETSLPFTTVLSIATKEGKFEFVSTMLPDARSYVDVGKFLNSRSSRANSL